MKHYERIISICSFLFLFVNVGLASTSFGVYQPYLAALPGIGDASASMVVSVRTFMALAAMFLVNRWYNRVDCRLGIALACFFTGIGFVLYAFASTLIGLCFGAAFAGLGYGLGGFVGMTLLTGRWYSEHVGTAIGFASLGSGIAGMIMPTIVHSIIASFSLSFAFITESAIAFIVGVLQLVLLRNRPTEMHTLIHHRTAEEKQAQRMSAHRHFWHKRLFHHGKEVELAGFHAEHHARKNAAKDAKIAVQDSTHDGSQVDEHPAHGSFQAGEHPAQDAAYDDVQVGEHPADSAAASSSNNAAVRSTAAVSSNAAAVTTTPSAEPELSTAAQALLIIACVFVGMVSVGGMAYISILLTSNGFDQGFAAWMLSVIGIALAASKFGSGELFDHIGTPRGTACLFVILVASLIMCCMAPMQNITLITIASIGFGLGVAVGSVGVSVWSLELSQPKHRAKMVKNLQIGYAIGAFLAGTFPGFLAELCGSYVPTYIILAITSTLAGIIILTVYARYRKNR